MSNIKESITKVSEKPGVYLFKDKTGRILYIGKAINLKKRVSSYFAKKHPDRPWTAVLVGLIDDVETIVVTNELEALMLEATLIKEHLPRFNIKLTDDKAYPFIKLTTQEAIPRFAIARKRLNDKAKYFGPYLSGRAASYTLEFLRRLYGIHISPTPLRANRDRPCLNCQLDGFSCPLNGEVDEEKYQERIRKAVDFLQGKRLHLVEDLEQRMQQAAADSQFELAAKLRDQLQAIRQVLNRQQVISASGDDYDALGISLSPSLSAIALLRIRDGRVMGQHSFFFEGVESQTAAEVLRQFLVSTYQNFSDIPPLITVPVAIDDQAAISQFTSVTAEKAVEIRVPERGEKRQLTDLATKNAQNKLESRLLHSDQAFTALTALKELLALEALPVRIEAVDISNLGTSEPVGATICLINGLPDKNEYRRYKIKTVEGQNDFAMITEVTRRRFSDTRRQLPDLFMVDGGKEQLKAALKALATTPLQPKTIISLAKKPDRIFLPGRKLPLPVKRGHKGLLLLSRARDEVHRFVIGFHRTRQRKKSLEN